jgi:hypothetical protein
LEYVTIRRGSGSKTGSTLDDVTSTTPTTPTQEQEEKRKEEEAAPGPVTTPRNLE